MAVVIRKVDKSQHGLSPLCSASDCWKISSAWNPNLTNPQIFVIPTKEDLIRENRLDCLVFRPLNPYLHFSFANFIFVEPEYFLIRIMIHVPNLKKFFIRSDAMLTGTSVSRAAVPGLHVVDFVWCFPCPSLTLFPATKCIQNNLSMTHLTLYRTNH